MMPNMPTGETMSEGSALPTMMDEAAERPTGLEQCVPLDALAQPDDEEQLNPPAVGDAVEFTVTGKVSRIEGSMAYVTPETVNGKDVKPSATSQGPAGGGDTLQSLEAEAKGMA
jgi:hypothetical protein